MESKEAIEALFIFANEGILITNGKGEIVRINPSAEKIFGYKDKELAGKKIEILIPPRFMKIHEKHRYSYNKNPHPRFMGEGDMDLYGRRKDSSEFPIEVSLSPYITDKEKFIIAFIIDITQRKLAEERAKNYSVELKKQVNDRTMILHEAIAELEKTKKELNEALIKERELNDLKTNFVSIASHEFRTPLATIMTSLSLMKKYGEQKEPEKQEKHFLRIKSSITNLTDILNDFLSVSKLEEGKISNSPEEFILDEFIKETVSELQPLSKKGQHIIYSSDGKSSKCLLDKKLLKNILFNLISNAIKFSPEGKSIEILTDISKSDIKISVTDNGIGISKEDKKHLFERFFRGYNATYIQGTGLGLNIVAKYVELMNGTIYFTSEENKGTTFTLIFTNR